MEKKCLKCNTELLLARYETCIVFCKIGNEGLEEVDRSILTECEEKDQYYCPKCNEYF